MNNEYSRRSKEKARLTIEFEESILKVYECCYKSVPGSEPLDILYLRQKLHRTSFFLSECRFYATERGHDLVNFLMDITSDDRTCKRTKRTLKEQKKRTSQKRRLMLKAEVKLVKAKTEMLKSYLEPHYVLFTADGSLMQPIRKIK